LGADVTPALNELQSLRERRAANKLYVALFGEISTGKSSLIKALLPNYHPLIDPRGGTTRKLSRYLWTHPGGDEVILTDMPGLNGNEEELDHMSREEARRSHLIIYLVNGDLTRDQYQELKLLIALQKPLILAINKADRLSPADLDAVRQRLTLRLGDLAEVDIVPVTAGGKREITKVYPDGREEAVIQDIPPQVDKLIHLLEQHLTKDPEQLERRRDAAMFQLAGEKLEGALVEHRQTRCAQLVSEYTRKAVFGALVAVGPGTDIIIQGYLGVSLIKGLCEIHEVPAKEMEISRFLKLATKNVTKTLPMLLAISGNAFKAFPGIGTVAGGLLHAVGYGLIFESLGKAVTATLAQGRGLETTPALQYFEEDLIDNLETRARRLAKLALAQEQEQNGPSQSRPGPR
jgi:GTP-binding protein EngB required for normal cell division